MKYENVVFWLNRERKLTFSLRKTSRGYKKGSWIAYQVDPAFF